MSARTCRVCGSADVGLRGRKPGTFLPREFEFHACRACGFMTVEPFSGFAIYDDRYYRGEGPDPYVDYEAEYRDYRRTHRVLEFDDMARIAARTLAGREREAATAAPLHWLDFGCGAGGFLKYLRELGKLGGRPLVLTGHDVGSYAELLKTADGFRILDLEELTREPGERYDVISMIEVVEHLPDPALALAQVARLLKPGGILLLTTGNLDSPAARRQGIAYRYCAPEIHVSLFGPRSLAALYRRAGLIPLPVRHHGAVRFKVLKTLRHRPFTCALAGLALRFPPLVRLVDWLYGVSAMPCAVKPEAKDPHP
jgi:SAM-dependent methyltransferase